MARFNRKQIAACLLLRRRAKARQNQVTHAHQTKEKKKHRWWVRDFLTRRQQRGHYNLLVDDLKNNDREWYYR